MEEMRGHVAGCPHCGARGRARSPRCPACSTRSSRPTCRRPTLPPSVEEAVLDRFARERRRAAPRRRRRRLTAAAPGRAAAPPARRSLVLALVVWSAGTRRLARLRQREARAARGGLRPRARPPGPRTCPPAPASACAPADCPRARRHVRAVVRARRRPLGQRRHLPRAPSDGRAEAVLTAAVRPGDYHVMVVTRHARGKHGPALLRGQLRY